MPAPVTMPTLGVKSLTASVPMVVPPPAPVADSESPTAVQLLWRHFSSHESSLGTRLVTIILLAILLHLVVRMIRSVSEWLIQKSHNRQIPLDFVTRQSKFVTFIQLISNAATFVMYFIALGLLLQELFALNLAAYLASASIIGLAISFGSQGLVQDVVISLTLIFSDALDVGDMVEIAGTVVVTGRVEELGLRFIMIRNLYNQTVFIPNRTIANVSRFPEGGLIAYADVQLPAGGSAGPVREAVAAVAAGMHAQFGAIILEAPGLEPVAAAGPGGWEYLRVRFKLWPGQGSLIETHFRQQIVQRLKPFDALYSDWQVAVTYRAGTAVLTGKTPHPRG